MANAVRTLALITLVSACSKDGEYDYVCSLNQLSLHAGDAADALFPVRAPSSTKAFAGENLTTAASALRELAEVIPIEAPPELRRCHALVVAEATALARIGQALAHSSSGKETDRVAVALTTWSQVQVRARRRLCGLSDALRSCARQSQDDKARVVGFEPARLRCP